MKIEVKGHSGCQIDVVREGRELFVCKSTADPKYLDRLVLQAEKQRSAADAVMQHIRIPKVHAIDRSPQQVTVKMDYVYSRNFVEFFDHAGFEQLEYLLEGLKLFIEDEIGRSPLQKVSADVVRAKFADVKAKTLANKHLAASSETKNEEAEDAEEATDPEIAEILERSEKVFDALPDMELPVGICHGDLTFSNILFNGNNYFLIDFLDSFIESPLLDIVKLRQDTAWHWSQLMYAKPVDNVRLRIAFSKIDNGLDSHFSQYAWYRDYYQPLQLMNFLRILQYAREPAVIDYLKRTLQHQLNNA